MAPLRGTARLRHWSRIPGHEIGDVLVAEAALARAQLEAWLRPRGELVQVPVAPHGGRRTLADPAARAAVAYRAVKALDRALRYGVVRPACLVRSIALARLLASFGVPDARIRLGVRRADATGDVDAHAWVELDGRVVGDDPRHTRRFTPIGSVSVAERR